MHSASWNTNVHIDTFQVQRLGVYQPPSEQLLGLPMQREAEITTAELTALYYPLDAEASYAYGRGAAEGATDLVPWLELKGASSDCGIGPFPDDEEFSLSVLCSLFPAVPREEALAAFHEAGCRSDEAVNVLIRQEWPINQVQSPFWSSARKVLIRHHWPMNEVWRTPRL
jgi:hypothetical protein